MAVTILNSANSFVRFDQADDQPHCIWGNVDFCLPVYHQEDVAFQFVISGLIGEIDSLCTIANDNVVLSILEDCGDTPLLVFSEKPQRFRLSETQVLYNWSHGFPNFTSVIEIGKCFKVQVEVTTVYETIAFCSNCFERVMEDCFTSVIEYGNDEDAFGFKYCNGGGVEVPAEIDCEPTEVLFYSTDTLAIPYTTYLKNKYGAFPTVQAWIYDGSGQLVNMGITIAFDAYPPSIINLDFGGLSSGIVIIR